MESRAFLPGTRPRAASVPHRLWRKLRVLFPTLALLIMIPELSSGCASHSATTTVVTDRLPYPFTVTNDVVDAYHGVRVADPYRWLEDDNSEATKRWVASHNQVTFAYLSNIPERAAIRARLVQLWNYERYGLPIKRGARYFLTRNDGLQNQSVLYTLETLDGPLTVLLDPNKLSQDGTVALSGFAPSDDGKLVAYGLATAGSDWQEWRVRDVETGADLPDVVRWVKFSNASWTRDGEGFFYSCYDEPKPGDELKGLNYFQKLKYHRLGTPQSEDRIVYERKGHKDWGFYGNVTDDGRYLVISISQGTDPKNRVYYQDLQVPGAPVVELLDDFDASYNFVANLGTRFFFHTDLNASRSRLIAIDITQPGREHWAEIIPESQDNLERVDMVHETFIAGYLHDATSRVKCFDATGRWLRDLELPGLGSVGAFSGRIGDADAFYQFTSFTAPGTVFRFDVAAGTTQVFRQPHLAFDPDRFVTEQVFYRSKDGTRIPMFLCYRKGLERNGQNPTYLYGYGGFRISLVPGFNPANVVWMEMGGVYAVANLRGGGEYGEDWHLAGTKLRKQNVFDDFIAAAEYLILNNYTDSRRLAIGGGSNGGLLVAACMTQRPGLFAAALPSVGVLDMLRFHKFTIGWAWTSDYGSSDDPKEFEALYAYSPLHRVRPGTVYPATLITTADHDDRVVPAHSFKFAAALQAAQAGTAPVLIRIETRAGHSAGKPVGKIVTETADRWAFLVRVFGMNLPPDFGSPIPAPPPAARAEPAPSAP